MNSDKESAAWVATFNDPTRLAILRLLAEGDKNVTELSKMLSAAVVNVSHHLGVLKQGKLVSDVKQGRFVIYSLKPGICEVSDGRITLTNPTTKIAVTIPTS